MTPAQVHETVPNKARVGGAQISIACKMRILMSGVVSSVVCDGTVL